MKTLTLIAAVPLALSPLWAAPGGPARSASAIPNPESQDSEIERAHAAILADLERDQARSRAELEERRNSDEYTQLREAGDFDKLNAFLRSGFQVDRNAYGRRYLELAKAHPGNPYTPTVLVAASEMSGEGEVLAEVIGILLQDHLQHEALADATLDLHYRAAMLGDETFGRLCAALIDSKAPAVVRAQAHFARSAALSRAARGVDNLSEADRERYEADRAAVLELAPESIAAYRVDADRFQREHLQIGMTAPEIVGEDVFGKPMTLSQFRGKVVVLDFWGDW